MLFGLLAAREGNDSFRGMRGHFDESCPELKHRKPDEVNELLQGGRLPERATHRDLGVLERSGTHSRLRGYALDEERWS